MADLGVVDAPEEKGGEADDEPHCAATRLAAADREKLDAQQIEAFGESDAVYSLALVVSVDLVM